MIFIARTAHPALDGLDAAFVEALLPRPLGELPTPASVVDALRGPSTADPSIRDAVRDLLRKGGFKPSGRSKPASEYLAAAAEKGALGSINPAADIGNAASLASGLPISVIDLDRAVEPLRLEVAGPGASFVFNPSGQSIDLHGLICLSDADGPCANAVKDAQRTKTDATSRRILVVVWGPRARPGLAAAVAQTCADGWRAVGASVEAG
jgi:DNA/RNA-binding domain of Phe-tRNA-synthetase-like protein